MTMPKFEIVAFRPNGPPPLVAWLDVRAPAAGFAVRSCSLHVRDGRAWVCAPRAPHLAVNGVVIRGLDGKIKFTNIVAFENAEERYAWSDAIVAAVLRDCPGVLPAGTIASPRAPARSAAIAEAKPALTAQVASMSRVHARPCGRNDNR